MVIGNFKNSRGHLEAYTAIVQNDHIRPILGLITMPIVINVEPVFLIRSFHCYTNVRYSMSLAITLQKTHYYVFFCSHKFLNCSALTITK